MKAAFERGIYRDIRKTKTNSSLPDEGESTNNILSLLSKWAKYEKTLWNGSKKYESGSVYHGDNHLIDLQNRVFALFARSNPLHPSTFPFVRKMLAEIVAMTITYFNGNPYKQKGLLTSGGTESILMAVRAYKYYAKSKWNKNKPFKPELILPVSAHAAFHKAAEMYEIKCITMPINNKNYKPDPKAIENAINENTIGIIGSAPDFAHGIMDDIGILSEIAYKYNIPFHVDCCLGSFLLPTISKMQKYADDIPIFDWRCNGITTISCDTHKFGFTTKGTSVLMFKSAEIRHHAYFMCKKSTIGLYCTPTIQGSRNGAVIACAWTVMMHLGKKGYILEATKIMKAVDYIKYEIINNNKINKNNNVITYGKDILNIMQFIKQHSTTNDKKRVNIHKDTFNIIMDLISKLQTQKNQNNEAISDLQNYIATMENDNLIQMQKEQQQQQQHVPKNAFDVNVINDNCNGCDACNCNGYNNNI
eukprot:167119_1